MCTASFPSSPGALRFGKALIKLLTSYGGDRSGTLLVVGLVCCNSVLRCRARAEIGVAACRQRVRPTLALFYLSFVFRLTYQCLTDLIL